MYLVTFHTLKVHFATFYRPVNMRMLPAFCRNNSVSCRQIPHEEAPAKKLRLSKPSKSAALHIDLCKATNSTDALQYLLQFARKPVEVESVEGVVRILLEHYYKVKRKYGSEPATWVNNSLLY